MKWEKNIDLAYDWEIYVDVSCQIFKYSFP